MPGYVSSPVTLSSVKSVYSGPNNLGAYNRGGEYVPNDSASDGISTTTSGLSLSQFGGKFIPYVNVIDRNIFNYKIGAASATLTWGISTDGRAFWYKDNEPATYTETVFSTNSSVLTSPTTDSINSMSYYEIYASAAAGLGASWGTSLTPLYTWVQLGGTAKSWTLRVGRNARANFNLAVSIRRISIPLTTVDSATINFDVATED